MADITVTNANQRLAPEERRRRARAAIAVLRSFREGDAEEQRRTGEYLLRALGEDRPAGRKHLSWP